MKEGRHETAESLLEHFQSQRGMLKQVGAVIGPNTSVVQQIAGDGNEVTDNHCRQALEQLEVTTFLMSANKSRYEGLFQDLENKFLKDQDNYPRTLNQAYSLLVNWKPPTYT